MSELAAQVESAKFFLRAKGELSGCTSYIQRKLECGYNRAAQILDALEKEGFITAPDERGQRRLVGGSREP
jgi:DNA segregation ATPase FtsK/SpoIIIE-like protein